MPRPRVGRKRGPALRPETARSVALRTIRRVIEEGAYSNLALAGELGRSALSARDRQIATDLVYGTLRKKLILDRAIEAIDSYLTKDTDNSIFEEPAFVNTFNNNLNGFLKWEQLGKSEAATPRFRQLLSITKAVMGTRSGAQLSLRDRIKAMLYTPSVVAS